MSSIKLDGNGAWFATPDNKYGLSNYAMKNITNSDFSFLAKVKVKWDEMNPNDMTREAGIIIKNGLHMGLSVVKPSEEHCYVKGTIWTSETGKGEDNPKNSDILMKLNWADGDMSFDKEYSIGFSMKLDTNEFSVFCNDQWKTEKYEGKLLDYANAWLWVGAANPLDSCPLDFRQFFNGEISYIAAFHKYLDKDEIKEVYENPDNISKRLKPACAYNFKRQTPYKVLDITGNGNNLIKFDKTWMDSI
jgi:hypothetical protein